MTAVTRPGATATAVTSAAVFPESARVLPDTNKDPDRLAHLSRLGQYSRDRSADHDWYAICSCLLLLYNDRNWEQSAGSAEGCRDVHTEACGDLGELAPDLGAERNAGRGAPGLAATAPLAGDEHLAVSSAAGRESTMNTDQLPFCAERKLQFGDDVLGNGHRSRGRR
jgi:hypothetical protein